MNLPTLITEDLEILTNIIKVHASCFVSPYVSFSESSLYLKGFNQNLEKYFELMEDNALYYEGDSTLLHLDLPQSFEIFLFFSYLKKDPFALETLKLIKNLNEFPIFRIKDFSHNSNPYFEIMNNIYKSSCQLLSGEISTKIFMNILENEKSFLFPAPVYLGEDITIIENSNATSFDLQLLGDECIVYLKEKIYLNLLFHFMINPEEYNNSKYLFLDFLGTFSFNSKDHFSFSHLKPFFIRFEEKHWNTIKKFKEHYSYNLVLDTIFIDYTFYNPNIDDPHCSDMYYFDFESFILLIKKKVILDDLFQCKVTENKDMRNFLYSILEKNNYQPDKNRFNNLMIIYEKNKMEIKFKCKNTAILLNKI